jgi:hypothetical protein
VNLTAFRRVTLWTGVALASLSFLPRAQGQGSLVSWGYDHDGEVSGTPAGDDFVAVSAGHVHSVALRSDGSLVSWGLNNYWDTDIPSNGVVASTPIGTGFVAVSAARYHCVALRSDGSLVAWGSNDDNEVFNGASTGRVSGTPNGTDFIAVSAGEHHSVALRSSGSLVSWGWNAGSGTITNTPTGTGFVAATAGDGGFSIALRVDGRLVSWGYNRAGVVSGTPTGTGFVAVSAGLGHVLALRSEGSLVSWGDNTYGQVSNTPPGTNFIAISAGLNHCLALRSDGSLASWGSNLYGQVGDTPAGTGCFAIAGGGGHSVAIRRTHPTASAGADQSTPEGSTVVLDGSASLGPTGQALTFTWTQIAGEPVTLNLANPAHPTFTAPAVAPGGMTLTFQLIVNNGLADSIPDVMNVTVTNVNHEPVAIAGDDQAVAEGCPATLSASHSYDEDDDQLMYWWTQTGGTPVVLADADTPRATFTTPFVGAGGELLTFELWVSDGMDLSIDTVTVFVENVNHEPTASAGTDQTRLEGATVTLDATASQDPDGDLLAYTWEQTGGAPVVLSDPNSASPTFIAPQVGLAGDTLTFVVTVNDGYGGIRMDAVQIFVQDGNTPPACELARASLPQLWPPNHKMVPVTILGVTDPDNDQVAITIVGVTQDEPINGLGDGDTGPDAVIQGNTVLLRAERAGTRNGRVYRVTFVAEDGFGGTCFGTVSVCVPHNVGRNYTCVEDPEVYDSLGQ